MSDNTTRTDGDELRESEQRYDTFVNALSDMAFLKDESGRHIMANNALLAFFGRNKSDVIGKTDFDLMPAENARNCRASDLKALQSGDIAESEECVSGRVYETRKFRVRLANGQWGMAGFVRDVTERNAQKQAMERLTRLFATLSQIDQTIVRVTSREELLREVCRVAVEVGGFKLAWIGWCDPRTRQVLPVARRGANGVYIDEITVYADDRPEGCGPTGTCIREGRPCIFNDFIRAPKALPWRGAALAHGIRAAAACPIFFKGEVWGAFTVYDGAVGVFQDKEVALLEEAAADISHAMDYLQQEERHRAVLRAAMDGFWLADIQGRLLEVNMAYCRMSGYSEQELLTMRIPDLDVSDTAIDIQKIMALGEHRFESRHRRKDGSVYDVEVAVQYKPGDNGWLVVFLHDISARKRTEDELLKMQKLQSVGTLAGGIAHDFNNILLGVFGNITLAKCELSKEHPCYSLLEESEKSMTRAVRLTKQLLTFAKGGEPVKEVVCLREAVEEIARFDLSGSNVSLVYRQSPDLWPVEADKGQLQQVVSNLTINARQAMPKGGHLHITLENTGVQQSSFPGLRPGRYVKIIIQDEGTGIDPKVLDQIFDPYFTTKQTGNGLGLATVWSVINKHGGHIGVVSELGKSTTFTVHLPASASAEPAANKPKPAADGQPPAPSKPDKVLVMDDDESVCMLASRMLKRCGYAVETVPDGQEAIARYRQALEAGEPFAAVIMDLTIPGGIGGKEAIQDLLAIDAHVRAIVSSGYAGDPVMANFADYGFKGIAAKPYTVNELRDVVARVLR